MTSPEERILRTNIARTIGRTLGPIVLRILPGLLVTTIYGLVNFFTLGLDLSHYLKTYAPVVGSLLSYVSLVAYPSAMYHGRSWRAALYAWSGFVPYLFGLFIMIVLGGVRLYSLLSDFSLAGLIVGGFWLVVGWWVLYYFWFFTEVVAAADKARTQALTAAGFTQK